MSDFDINKSEDAKVNVSAQETMNLVLESTNKVLDGLQHGHKTTMKDLTDKVVAETKVQVSVANGLVPMFVHAWAGRGEGTVEKGRNGGIFKGGKQKRIDPRARCETCNQVIRPKKTL